MTGSNENVVTAALRSVLADYGWNAASNPARLRAALNDQLGVHAADYRASVDAIVLAAEEGVATGVRAAGTAPGAVDPFIAQLVDWGLSQDTAGWAVTTWASMIAPPTQVPPTTLPQSPLGGSAGGYPEPEQPNWGQDSTALPPGGVWSTNDAMTAAPVPPLYPTELAGSASDTTTPRKRGLSRGRVLVIAAVIAALVAGVGAYFLFSGDDEKKVQLTYAGDPVDKAEVVLAATESIVTGIVKRRHGVAAADSHCYFAKQADAKDKDAAEVSQSIYCGPVLFVDGDPDREYLAFALKSEDAGSHVVLSAGDSPVTSSPLAVPAGETLIDADGAPAPPRIRLTPPDPPPASGGELLATSGVSSTPPAAFPAPIMASRKTGVTLTAFGRIERYGQGDNARSAPEGGKLIAFDLDDAICDSSPCRGWRKSGITLVISGGGGRQLPPRSEGEHFVVALPAGVSSAYLHMRNDGYTQTLSILNGRPGAHNIRVLGRNDLYDDVQKTFRLTERSSIDLRWDGASFSSRTSRMTVKLTGAALYFFLNGRTPRSTNRAFLRVFVELRRDTNRANPKVFDPEYQKFIASDGRTYRGIDIDRRDHFAIVVFVVPANVQSGTYVLGGSHMERADNGTPYRDTIPVHRVRIRF